MVSTDTASPTPVRSPIEGVLVVLLVAGLIAIAGLMIAGLADPENLNSRWSIFIGGLAAIVLFLGILATFLTARRVVFASSTFASAAHQGTTNAAPRGSPFGDVHPVVDVEGIGAVYERKLEAIAITDTKQLWESDALVVAETIGVHENQVRSWQVMAELMAINDVGKQYAELLMRSGVRSIEDLAAADPQTLTTTAQGVEASREVRIQGNAVSLKLVRRWIAQAKTHRPGRTATKARA